MYKTLSTALQRPIVRWAISALFFLLLALAIHRNWSDIAAIRLEDFGHIFFAGAVVLSLTFFNLFSEAKKWETLLASEHVGWKESLFQVTAGISCGFLTPNRVGEFAGRRHFLPEGEKYKALTLTAVGGGVQGLVTIIFGLVGLAIFPLSVLDINGVIIHWYWFVFFGLIIFAFILGLKKRWRFLEDIMESFAHIRQLQRKRILAVLMWSGLRYLVFSTQFVLALLILGFEGSIEMCYAGVFLLYLCQSYIPGASLGELGVREVLALFIFGASMPYPLLAALAGFMMWVANIAIPVLIGSLSFGLGRTSFR